MSTTTLLLAAHYADSAYPAGGYAQSWGLETGVAEGQIRDMDALTPLLRLLLRHHIARTDAVAAAAGCRSATADDRAGWRAVDGRLYVTRTAREAREASTRTGRRLLETAARTEGDPFLQALLADVAAGRSPGCHGAVLGAVLGRLGLDGEAAAGLALWGAANGYLAAAVRLLPITHDEVQHALVTLRPLCAALASGAAAADPAAMAGSIPWLEVWSMRHETASVRLFAS